MVWLLSNIDRARLILDFTVPTGTLIISAIPRKEVARYRKEQMPSDIHRVTI
jgi:hypothetical protein